MTLVEIRPPWGPEDFCDHSYNGLDLLTLGEETDWIAGYGHIDAAEFAVAAAFLVRDCFGDDDEIFDPADVHHVWAVVLRDPHPHVEDAGELLEWNGVTPATRGAFPITLLRTGWTT